MQRAQNEANSLLREQRHTDQPFRTRIAGIHALSGVGGNKQFQSSQGRRP